MTTRMNLSMLACVIGMTTIGMVHAQDSNDKVVERYVRAVLAAASPGGMSFIGVSLAEVDNERAKTLKLRDVHGVEITSVEENSPAAKGGLKAGDVVLEYNGQRVEGMEQFGRLVRETPAGREAKLVVSRDGNVLTIPVTVGTRADMPRTLLFHGPDGNTPGFNVKDFSINMPEMRMPNFAVTFPGSGAGLLGVEAESLNTQLAQAFGVKEGVLVRWVGKDSAAEKAGIRAGDVITKIDSTAVASPRDVANALRSARAKKTFPVLLTRDRHEVTVTVTLDQERSERPAPVRTQVVNHTIRM
jgi:serine protease Do